MSEELCRRLRDLSAARHDDLSIGEDAAALIEQQTARIAELEAQAWCGGTEAKTVRATRDEPLSPACAPCKAPGGTCFPEPCGRYQQRRAEAAEAEVKRLREVLRKIELKDTKIQYGGNIYDAAGGIIDTVETEEFFGPCARLAREALAIQEPRHE